MRSLLIKNIGTLYGINEENHFKKGTEMSEVNTSDHSYLYIEDGNVHSYGKMEDCNIESNDIVDAEHALVLPGFCDSHTHLVFAASREEEFVYRLKGMSYSEIAEKGGGILNSAKKLQAMDEDELFGISAERLHYLISKGTTAIEMKSGYGLTLESELKTLRVIKRLKEKFKIPIKATFMGAHAMPIAYKDDRQSYIDLIINNMMPKIAEENLADYCDVFCDKGFFTLTETDQILNACIKFGMKPKLHANELANSGGVQLGIKHRAISVDHLEEIGDKEIEALSQSSTIPTVLPSCSYFLNIPYAPARKMIDSGLGISIASDYNPGTTPSGNMLLLFSIACTQMKLLPEEVFNAITNNGAHAMEVADLCGSIGKGKLANLIITKPMKSIAYIPYAFGEEHIKHVIVNGSIY